MMKINGYEFKNKNLEAIAETLSDHGYIPAWKTNDGTGDWYIGMMDEGCEAIYCCWHDGFGEEVIDCFLNECDKGKDIGWEAGRFSNNCIYVKERYAVEMTEDEKEILCEGGM